jgi:hypothetical protein
VAAALCPALAPAASAAAGAHIAAVARASSGTWGTAEKVPGLAALNQGGNAVITSVSCASPGNCSAGGSYASSRTRDQAFVVDETGGSWGTAQQIAAARNKGGEARLLSVSCTSPGNCSAGGYYASARTQRGPVYQAFVVGETDGTWGNAQEVAAALNKGGGAQITSVSCASPGNCGAGGFYTGIGAVEHAFVISEANGIWGTAAHVPGTMYRRHLISAITSVSCASAGNCSAGGDGPNSTAPDFGEGFMVGETNGVWGRAQAIPDVTAPNQAEITSVSCAAVGNCGAGGSLQIEANPGPVSQALVVDETDGTLGQAQEVAVSLNKNGFAQINSVSCPSAGNCSAGGFYTGGADRVQGFVIGETNGTWGKAEQVPGIAALNTGRDAEISSVSCASPGNCSAGGFYTVGGAARHAFVVSETDGTWGTAQEVAAALDKGGYGQVSSVSCALPGNCGAGGQYRGRVKEQAFVIGES